MIKKSIFFSNRTEKDIIKLAIDQFKRISEMIQQENLADESTMTEANRFFSKFYKRLQDYTTENRSISSDERHKRLEWLKQRALPARFVYCARNSRVNKFLDVDAFAFEVEYPCEPTLMRLPDIYMANHHDRNFFQQLGVRDRFTFEMLVRKLKELELANAGKPLDEQSEKFCLKVIEELLSKNNMMVTTINNNSELFVPDCDKVMRKLTSLYSVEDEDEKRLVGLKKNSNSNKPPPGVLVDPSLELYRVHPSVNAARLGIRDIKSKVFAKIGRPFGQKESLVNRIKDILTRYSGQFCLFKVLNHSLIKLQN